MTNPSDPMSVPTTQARRSTEVAVEHDGHPLRIGASVTVLGLSPRSVPFIEGRALVRHIACRPHAYWVEFIGDPVLRERVIHPGTPDDPTRTSLALTECEQKRREDAEAFADFFPDQVV